LFQQLWTSFSSKRDVLFTLRFGATSQFEPQS